MLVLRFAFCVSILQTKDYLISLIFAATRRQLNYLAKVVSPIQSPWFASILIKSTEIWSACGMKAQKKCKEIFLSLETTKDVKFVFKSTVSVDFIHFYCNDNANCLHFNRRNRVACLWPSVFPVTDLMPFIRLQFVQWWEQFVSEFY